MRSLFPLLACLLVAVPGHGQPPPAESPAPGHGVGKPPAVALPAVAPVTAQPVARPVITASKQQHTPGRLVMLTVEASDGRPLAEAFTDLQWSVEPQDDSDFIQVESGGRVAFCPRDGRSYRVVVRCVAAGRIVESSTVLNPREDDGGLANMAGGNAAGVSAQGVDPAKAAEKNLRASLAATKDKGLRDKVVSGLRMIAGAIDNHAIRGADELERAIGVHLGNLGAAQALADAAVDFAASIGDNSDELSDDARTLHRAATLIETAK